MKSLKLLTLTTMAALSLGLSTITIAHGDAPDHETRRGHGDDKGGEHFRRGDKSHGEHRLKKMARELELSENQQKDIKALFSNAKGQHKAQREAMHTAKTNLHEAIRDGASKAKVRKLANKVGNLVADKAMQKYRMHKQMAKILTAEQQQKMQAMHEQRRQKMDQRRQHRMDHKK